MGNERQDPSFMTSSFESTSVSDDRPLNVGGVGSGFVVYNKADSRLMMMSSALYDN
jgi:hypothetical protein